jgi:hypothetical protein
MRSQCGGGGSKQLFEDGVIESIAWPRTVLAPFPVTWIVTINFASGASKLTAVNSAPFDLQIRCGVAGTSLRKKPASALGIT